jgi:hypothetical protein
MVFIDCVDRDRQPGLKIGEKTKSHLPLEPARVVNVWPNAGPDGVMPTVQSFQLHAGELDENGNARRCPEQTVPIRRVTMDDLKRFATLDDFFSKHPPLMGPVGPEHEWATMNATPDGSLPNFGGQARFNIWNNYVMPGMGEFSVSQIWVSKGTGIGTDLQTVETGLLHYFDLYGDDLSHLFIYSTQNNYQMFSPGCYDGTCNDFYQTDHTYLIGGVFNVTSTLGGTQAEEILAWQMDDASGDWWLLVGNTWLGYYPSSLFYDVNPNSGLNQGADSVEWGGGEIYNYESNGQHTATQMGSGYFPSSGVGYAAFTRQLKYFDRNFFVRNPTLDNLPPTDHYCYDVISGDDTIGDPNWGIWMLFGGPGYNVNCE